MVRWLSGLVAFALVAAVAQACDSGDEFSAPQTGGAAGSSSGGSAGATSGGGTSSGGTGNSGGTSTGGSSGSAGAGGATGGSAGSDASAGGASGAAGTAGDAGTVTWDGGLGCPSAAPTQDSACSTLGLVCCYGAAPEKPWRCVPTDGGARWVTLVSRECCPASVPSVAAQCNTPGDLTCCYSETGFICDQSQTPDQWKSVSCN